MSQIRQKFGSTLMNTAMQATRHGGHAAAVSTKVVAKPDEANHLTVNWLRRLQQTATTPDAREAHSQLASILDFYNIEKKAKEQASIDW